MKESEQLLPLARPRFKPYTAYKDSGVEWLGEIPVHWEVRRLKTIASVQLSNIDKKSVEDQESVRLCNYVDVYYNDHITPDLDFMAATATPEQVRRFSLHAGNVLITKDSESWMDIAVPAVVTSDLPDVLCGYHLALVRPAAACDGAFLARAFAAIGPRDQFQVAANGITRFGLGGDAIRTGLFATPPAQEQRAIAAFLDRETTRIDALVAKKERLIELLQEQRTALITRAVTKGLDPNVPMKDSGVEWLGEIPAHWEVRKGRLFGALLGCSLQEAEKEPSEPSVPYFKVSDLNQPDMDLDLSEAGSRIAGSLVTGQRKATRLLLFPKRGAAIFTNKVCIARAPCAFDSNVMGWHITAHENAAYVAYVLIARGLEDLADVSSVPQINNKHIYPAQFPRPPRDEQEAISAFIKTASRSIESLIGKVSFAIERLKELRTALISAAVTGKIDVRAS